MGCEFGNGLAGLPSAPCQTYPNCCTYQIGGRCSSRAGSSRCKDASTDATLNSVAADGGVGEHNAVGGLCDDS